MTIGVFYFCHSWLDQESRGMQRYMVPGSRIIPDLIRDRDDTSL